MSVLADIVRELNLDFGLQPQQLDLYKLYRKWGRQAATVIGFGGARVWGRLERSPARPEAEQGRIRT